MSEFTRSFRTTANAVVNFMLTSLRAHTPPFSHAFLSQNGGGASLEKHYRFDDISLRAHTPLFSHAFLSQSGGGASRGGKMTRAKVLKWAAAWCFAAVLFVCSAGSARAAGFSAQLSAEHLTRGETLSLTVNYDGDAEKIGAFLLRVQVDENLLSYQRVTNNLPEGAYFVTQEEPGGVSSVYVQKNAENCLQEAGALCTYRFLVSDTAPAGSTSVSVSVEQVLTPEAEELPGAELSLNCTIDPPPGETAILSELTPSAGELTPAFSAEQYDYTLTVPFEVTSLDFSAQADENGTWKVNRKNLGAGGSNTEFRVTVTAEDGTTKAVYRITVHREEQVKASASPKPSATAKATAKPTATPKSTKTPKPSATPKATKTPKPSKTPKPTKTPKPSSTTAATSEPPTTTVVYRSSESNAYLLILVPLAVVAAQLIFSPLVRWVNQQLTTEKREDDDDDIDDA